MCFVGLPISLHPGRWVAELKNHSTDFDIGIAGELVAQEGESIKQSKKQTFAPADAFERGGRLLKSREVAQALTDQIDRHHRNPMTIPANSESRITAQPSRSKNELPIPRPSPFPGRIIENKPRSQQPLAGSLAEIRVLRGLLR